MMHALKKGRTLTAFLLALCLTMIMSSSAFADAKTQVLFPTKGYSYDGYINIVVWQSTADVKASQVNITALDGSFVYNSGPIYTTVGTTINTLNVPSSIYLAMPRGKTYSVYIEDYHYSGNNYTGYSSDQGFFYLQ